MPLIKMNMFGLIAVNSKQIAKKIVSDTIVKSPLRPTEKVCSVLPSIR